MGKRVLVMTRDLFFRSKLGALVKAAGGELTRDEATCDIAVIELGAIGVEDRIREFIATRARVLAFTSHTEVEQLRAARALGAVAVPNSDVERTLRGML